MARRSQCSDTRDNPLDPNYLPPHYREEYRLAIDALVEEDVDGYYKFLQFVDVVDFLSPTEVDYIQRSVQLPKLQSGHPEPRYLDTAGDSSSDTYWPLHSDLDAPGLDLGWPQIHHFIGPTEVTTLVNPAAPDMPSIKEQARRLIKNAQMVIAVVMDMFTDVDIFADILNAASRNVAVYLLLDEANVDHFIQMVNNCRVNLQSIPYLRVRTVTGIRYHCRSGKSFTGQMLDRFILTDCRAVLSGNYSFMWSYEKLHRCMAHLFLGQLVSTFDEEFRILFAQSEPLVIENTEDMTILQKRPLPGERPQLRDTRKFHTMDAGLQEDWNRTPYQENVDWRMMPLKRQETFHGPLDIYNRYPSPQSRLDPQTRLEPQFDQGPPRMMDSHKRHSFAEGGPGRYNLPYQQQGVPDVEQFGRPYYRGQQQPHPREEPDYGGYGQMEKFWNQDFQQEEPYPEPGYEPHEGYDPVLNYLSSTRNLEMDQSSDKLIPGPDLPYSTTHSRRHIGQAYACQTSPTPSNTTEKKFMPEHSSDRKDPTVKKGLRNWRISSYLNTYDSSGEPEGLPMGQDQAIDPFDDIPNPQQQPTPPPPPPAGIELAVPKIPNVREFKVPTMPRASQMPAFAKVTPRDLPKRFHEEIPQVPPPVVVVTEPKVITPTPSESSSTTDGEKQEEPEQRDPITSTLRRDDSFRRMYNTAVVQRGSRLKSSLIFTSLEQNTNQDNAEQDDDKTKAEMETTKLPFSQILAQRRGTREPFEWKSYIKSTDTAKIEEDMSKPAEKESESKLEGVKESKDVSKIEVPPTEEVVNTKEAAKSPELTPKVDKAMPKIEPQPPPLELNQATKPFLSEPFVDMNDPDQRLLFFKELAAKRRAEKAAEQAKLKQESAAKDKVEDKKAKTIDKSGEVSKTADTDLSGKKDQVETKIVTKDINKAEKAEKDVGTTSTAKSKEESKKRDARTLDLSGKNDKVESCEKVEPNIVTKDKAEKAEKDEGSTITTKSKDVKTIDHSKITQIDSGVIKEPISTQSCEKTDTKVTTDSQKIEAKQSQACKPMSSDKKTQENRQASQKIDAPKSAEKQDEATAVSPGVGKVAAEDQPATTSKEPQLKPSRSVPDFTKTSMTDLLSSLPSSRIYERLSTQEANKDAGPKTRLWSPSLHKRDSFKAYGEKLKSLSTVVQEETGQTLADIASKSQEMPSVKSQISDTTETKAESVTSASESKESDKAKSQCLALITEKMQITQSEQEKMTGKSPSSGTEVTQDDKKASPSSVSLGGGSKQASTMSEKVTPESQKCQEKSITGAPDVKEDKKDSTHSSSVTSEEPKTKVKTELAPDKGEDTESKKPHQEQDKASLASISDAKQPQTSQNPDSSVKSSHTEVKDCEKQNISVDQEQPKTVLNQTEAEKCSNKPIDTSVKLEKMAEKSNVEAAAKTPNFKDSAKTSAVSQEVVELTSDHSVVTPSPKDPEKSRSTLPSDKTGQEASATSHVDETKSKLPEDSQIESHSNTSSPVSFATALEFISSEDSDMFSPAKIDPQHLFKSGHTESSVSDMSDFETPNSEFSMSPMPFSVNMNDGVEDNVSIAETVIETASRQRSETTNEGKADGKEQEASSKEGPQTETPKERLAPETRDMNVATAQSEVKVQSATSEEVSRSNLSTPDTEKTSEAGKIRAKSENETTKESPSPASSRVQETKPSDNATEVMRETGAKTDSKRDLPSEAVSTDVKTQDVTGQSERKVKVTDKTMASSTSSATSGETKDSRMDTTTELNKESMDVKSLDLSEAKAHPTNQSTSQKTDSPSEGSIHETETRMGSKSTESNKESEEVQRLDSTEAKLDPKAAKTPPTNQPVTSPKTIAQEPPSEASKCETKNRTVSSRFLSPPSVLSVENQANAITSKVTEEKTEIKEESPSTDGTGSGSTMDIGKEVKDQKACESETNVVVTDINPEIQATLEAKTEDKITTDKETKEVPAASGSVVSEKDEKGDSKMEVSNRTSSEKQSETSSKNPAKQEDPEKRGKDTDVGKEKEAEVSSNTIQATSEDTKVLDKQAEIVKEASVKAVSDQKSDVKPKDMMEATPPKPQTKPSQSRYLSSTANVISSSNLRDDTKILLEQISAQSQSRNEQTAAAKEAPVTDDEKEDEADKNAKRKKENELRSSLGQQKTNQDREKVLERIQTMRKDRKVYSRFEL